MADRVARTASSRVGPQRPDPSVGRAPIPNLAERRAIPPGGPASPTRVLEILPGGLRERDDLLVAEEPLAIRACGPGQEPIEVAVTMRTPGDEVDLALGFLFTEGLIEGRDVVRVELGDPGRLARPEDEVTVRLARPLDLGRIAERRFVATAACGLCGKASIDEIAFRATPPPPDRPVVEAAVLASLTGRLRAAQPTFGLTGGLHAAALFRPDGALVAVREDVGRHNALDKLIGSQLRANRLPLHDAVLLVSGRLGFELVQKAAVAGIPIVAAVSAPSDLAVEAATRLGITVVGFLRAERCNVYSGAERIRATSVAVAGTEATGGRR